MKEEDIEMKDVMFEAKAISFMCFLVLIGFMTLIGVAIVQSRNLEKTPETPKFTEPIVTNWQPEKEFVTATPVERISELEIGRVIIKPIDDSVVFPVLVIPFRDISIGTKVEIIELENLSDTPFRRSLIMIKPIKRKSFP